MSNRHYLIFEEPARRSVYQLYSVIYHSKDLHHLTASKTHPSENLRNHLIGVVNWTLFLLRIRASAQSSASAILVG